MSEVTIPDVPISRVEQYLNNIATGSGALPPYPISRKEQYLAKIAENGGGGGSATWGSITGTLSNQTDLSELLDTKANKSAIVKDTTTADATVAAAKNTHYIYGELTDLTVTWGTGEDDAEIHIFFKSGATATTMLVSTTGAVFASFTPTANKIVEIDAKWYIDKWVVLFHETAVTA